MPTHRFEIDLKMVSNLKEWAQEIGSDIDFTLSIVFNSSVPTEIAWRYRITAGNPTWVGAQFMRIDPTADLRVMDAVNSARLELNFSALVEALIKSMKEMRDYYYKFISLDTPDHLTKRFYLNENSTYDRGGELLYGEYAYMVIADKKYFINIPISKVFAFVQELSKTRNQEEKEEIIKRFLRTTLKENTLKEIEKLAQRLSSKGTFLPE